MLILNKDSKIQWIRFRKKNNLPMSILTVFLMRLRYNMLFLYLDLAILP
jgi:hypothetical protein